MLRALLFAAATGVAATSFCAEAEAGPTFDAVKQHGFIQCGINTGLAGFALPDSQGKWTGLDIDTCHALAAAVFGDAGKVKFMPLNAQVRFAALQSGEVDVLVRNTTWTLSRNAALGLEFTAVNFYDGQGFMVPKSLGVTSAKQLGGATVCVQPGTTTELNLTNWFRAKSLLHNRFRERRDGVFWCASVLTGWAAHDSIAALPRHGPLDGAPFSQAGTTSGLPASGRHDGLAA